MPRTPALALLTAATLLGASLPLVLAHGDNGDSMAMGMDMKMGDAAAAQDAPAPSPAPAPANGADPQSYFSYNEHVGMLYTYALLTVVTWVVVCPIAVMFSVARSRYTLPAQIVFLLANGVAVFVGTVYDARTPDLYPNNAHHKLAWALTWISLAWVLMGLVDLYSGRGKGASEDNRSASQPLSAAVMAQYQRLQMSQQSEHGRWSNDSGQGTERNSASLFSHSRSPSAESENQRFEHQKPFRAMDDEEDDDVEDAEKRGFLRDSRVDRFLSRHVPRIAVGRTLSVVRFFYVLIERLILVLGFVSLATGAVAMGGIAHGSAVLNVLAHFIKGAIFLWYGLLTLGRWMGCFADFGWAWNVKPPAALVGHRKAAIPSAEFTESFVIFLYGASNVFLEHLAAWGDEWTAQDLEHVSITIMFFGGGALGMLVESTRVRDLLNTTILDVQHHSADPEEPCWQRPQSYRASLNPLPALVILLLGMMMGSHHQASMLSSMVHKQWGNMFMGFAMARAATYLLLYLSPPSSYLPARPPTEIITAFCLVSGGLTFMISNKDSVAAMESLRIDAMFTFTVTIGLTALLMAWTVVLLALKGWALRREKPAAFNRAPRAAAAVAMA
ncbi:hypothetical protein K490DRAFT_59523 [Saccharata proteae CBS 121410]|uniref:Integral membrane protein n=1 Tax=Saccharata proteae CBS 121410 TaxID=1314787 RepID=A0A9P4LU74_9PEZI|nr:hypothetical protein K490DRAFT_59523 [Saccharata proteae CBS 121410]